MAIHPMAGQPAPASVLIDVTALERAYFEHRPDPGDPRQCVAFGTSGHRGTPGDNRFTEAHILAITKAICDYRRDRGIDDPSSWARTRMPCPARPSGPRWTSWRSRRS